MFDAAAERQPQLDAVSRGLELLGDIAGTDAPQRFLIAVANTAEMRGGGGMILAMIVGGLVTIARTGARAPVVGT